MHNSISRAIIGGTAALITTLCPETLAISGGREPAVEDARFDAVCAFSRADPAYLPSNNSFGSGTLIAPSVVVIAQHLISLPDGAGRRVCDAGFDSQTGGGPFAVRFRRRPDGTVGSNSAGAGSFFDVRVQRIEAVPGCPDIAIAHLAEPVNHIPPMPVSFDSRTVRGSRVTLAGWGHDGPDRQNLGNRGRLLIGDCGLGRPISGGTSLAWAGGQQANLYDSGGAVVVQGTCGTPVLVGVITNPTGGVGLGELPTRLRQLASTKMTCDVTGQDSLYVTPPPETPVTPPGTGWDPGLPSDPPRSAAPQSPFGPLAGAWSVGRMTFEVSDLSRLESLTKDKRDLRRLAVTLWYPCSPAASSRASAFTSDIPAFAARAAPEFRVRTSEMQARLIGLSPRSWERANPASTGTLLPVVLLEHDVGRSPEQYASTGEDLASNGFLVVAVNHTFDSVASVTLAGLAKPSTDGRAYLRARADLAPSQLRAILARWTTDSSLVINTLHRTLGTIGQAGLVIRADFTRVIAVGHGVGAAAAATLCSADPRMRCGAALDGLVPNFGAVPRSPFMVFQTNRSASTTEPPEVPGKALLRQLGLNAAQYSVYRQAAVEALRATAQSPQSGGARLVIGTDDHEAFSDASLLRGTGPQPAEARARAAVNAHVVSFARAILLQEGSAALSGLSASYPEVRVDLPLP